MDERQYATLFSSCVGNWDCALRRVGTGRTHTGFRKPTTHHPSRLSVVSTFAKLNRNVVFFEKSFRRDGSVCGFDERPAEQQDTERRE